MEGARGLLVEARLLDQPRIPSLRASLRVQGTNDGNAEKKNWANEGDATELTPGVLEHRTFRDVRPRVRVVVEVHTAGGTGRIEIRLTRML